MKKRPEEGDIYREINIFDINIFSFHFVVQDLLAEHKYEYVLDRACVQFEPDEAEYVSVSTEVCL